MQGNANYNVICKLKRIPILLPDDINKKIINRLNIYRAVLGGADDRNCTYNDTQSNGYLKRQVTVAMKFKV